jgi:hypothetical protein
MTTDTTALVKLALNKNGYDVDFLSARFVKTTTTDEVHELTYYNDDGELETGTVYVNLTTGKGEF